MVVTETIVKTRGACILTKLAVRDRLEGVMVAYETGIIRCSGA